MSGEFTDPYTDPSTGVLRNLLGITDADVLHDAETDFALSRAWELAMGARVAGDYDLEPLQAFHRFLFGDVYPWAGQLRTVNTSKLDVFCLAPYIPTAAAGIFGHLAAQDHLRGRDIERFTQGMAKLFGDLVALHPFREGNGRAMRAFCSQLASDAGWWIDWTQLDPRDNITASRAGMVEDLHTVAAILRPLINPLERRDGAAPPQAGRNTALRAARTAAVGFPGSLRLNGGERPGAPGSRPPGAIRRAGRGLER